MTLGRYVFSALMGIAILVILCSKTVAGPVTATLIDGSLWIENDYYKWDVTGGSQFIVKTGTNPRDWRAYPGKTPDATNYFLRIGRDDGSTCPVQWGVFGRNGTIIQQSPSLVVVRFRDVLIGTANAVETTLTCHANASFIRLQYRIFDPWTTLPRAMEYGISLLPGGDKGTEDVVSWPGLVDGTSKQTDIAWPFGGFKVIKDADLTTIPGSEWTYTAAFDKNVNQGLAMMARKTNLRTQFTDIHYGLADFDDRDYYDAFSLMRMYTDTTLSADLCLNIFTASDPAKWWESIAVPYDEAEVRYILADITLGAPLADFQAKTDPNSVEAVRRWNDSNRAASVKFLERKDIPTQGLTVVYKGTNDKVNGDEVLIMSLERDEATVRYVVADLSLGGPISYYRARVDDPNVNEALVRWDAGMRPTNSADFERRFLTPFGWAITYKGTTDIIDGMDVRLSDWSEMEVRYILADIALGGPVDYYRARTDVPDAVEALRRYDAGVQCMNSAEFERTFVRGRGGWEILYAGTSRRLWGYDVKLVSGPVPGDVAPVSDTGLFIGPNGHRYGDGILSMEDAAYTLRVLAGLNAIP